MLNPLPFASGLGKASDWVIVPLETSIVRFTVTGIGDHWPGDGPSMHWTPLLSLWSMAVFNAEYEEGVFSRVQTRGGRAAGKQQSAFDAGGNRGGHLAVDVAELANGGSRRDRAIRTAASPGLPPMPSAADQASPSTRLGRELNRTRMERDVLN